MLLPICLGLILLRLVQVRVLSGLSKFPGPFWGSVTDLWRLVYSYRIMHREPYVEIHRQYGDIVRLGPNMLSFASPDAVRDIYGAGKNFKKSEFYSVISPVQHGVLQETAFSTRNQADHARYRRAVNPAFSMSSILKYEGWVDETTEVLMNKLREMIGRGESNIDLPRWLQNYAFDTVAMMAYSKPFGFMQRNVDIDGIIKTTRMILDYTAHFGCFPFLDWLALKNPFMLCLGRLGLFELTTPLVPWSLNAQKDRVAAAKAGKGAPPHQSRDLLDTYLALSREKPDVLGDVQVNELGVMIGFAGSESTTSSLSALIYHVVRNPTAHRKLVAEVRDPAKVPKDEKHISYATASALPYLDACVKESFRVQPPGASIMERVVPPAGARIAGHDIPPGTVVGCSAWPVQRSPELFGPDPDTFRPERWLAEDAPRTREMWAAMLHFGGGAHTCMGKNVSLLEIYKLGALLFREFEISLEKPEKPAKLTLSMFLRMEYRVVMKERE